MILNTWNRKTYSVRSISKQISILNSFWPRDHKIIFVLLSLRYKQTLYLRCWVPASTLLLIQISTLSFLKMLYKYRCSSPVRIFLRTTLHFIYIFNLLHAFSDAASLRFLFVTVLIFSLIFATQINCSWSFSQNAFLQSYVTSS